MSFFLNLKHRVFNRVSTLATLARLRITGGGGIDLYEERYDGHHVVLWPISARAKTFMKEALQCTDEDGNPAKMPKMWGGYIVSRPIREQIHHTGCPLIATSSEFGLIVDTP